MALGEESSDIQRLSFPETTFKQFFSEISPIFTSEVGNMFHLF